MAVNSCSASVFRPVSALVPTGRRAASQLNDMSAWAPASVSVSERGLPQPGTTASSTDGLSPPRPTPCSTLRRAAVAVGTGTQRSGTAIRRPWAGPPTHNSPAGRDMDVATGLLAAAYMARSAWVDRLPPPEQPVMARARPAASADTGSRAGMRLISDPPGDVPRRPPGNSAHQAGARSLNRRKGYMRPNGSFGAGWPPGPGSPGPGSLEPGPLEPGSQRPRRRGPAGATAGERAD